VTLPHEFGNPVTKPLQFGSSVTWATPDPEHFGNTIGGAFNGFALDDGSGVIVLDDGVSILLQD
jgi:hypothetical protein